MGRRRGKRREGERYGYRDKERESPLHYLNLKVDYVCCVAV